MEFEEDYDETEETDDFIPQDTDKHIGAEDYIFSLYITDNLRQIFILVILVGNFVSVNIAVIFMCLAWYVKSSVEKQITFLQDFYNPQAVPTMVGLSGFIMFVASILGVKAGIGGRMMDDEGDMKSAAEFLFYYSVAAAVTFGFVLITALTCFIEIGILSSALGEGFSAGMHKYKDEPEVKPEIDILQIDYKCCGSKSYKDWYNVSWVAAKHLETGNGFIRKSMKKNEYHGKDVPFSCCKWNVMRPCVDTRVEDGSYNSKYRFPADLTLHTAGCRDAVSGFLGHTVFKGVGLFAFFCSFLWMALAVLGRYLNTSMTNMSAGEPPIGWLIPYVKPQNSAAKKESTEVEETEVEETEVEESESE